MTQDEKNVQAASPFGTALVDTLNEARELAWRLEKAVTKGVMIQEVVDREDRDFGRYTVSWLI